MLCPAQSSFSETEMVHLNDSICREGNLLYQYEKAYHILMAKAVQNGIEKESYSTHLVYANGQGMRGYGNDFVFFGDETGQLRTWKKFHPSFNLVSTTAANARENRHIHSSGEPFITATNICVFKLYGTAHGQKSFFVRSPGAGKVFEYNMAENRIIIHNADYLEH